MSLLLICEYTFLLTKQRESADCLADKVVESIGGRSHHGCSARITEVALDPDLFPKCRPAADSHRQIRNLSRRLSGSSFNLQNTQHGVFAPSFRSSEGIKQQSAAHVRLDPHA